jgi:DNA repair protein RecO (recombination protein O)
MSQTYKATGINLKVMPLGEADRLLTILTREHGLVRAVAMGCRKPNSKLGGRSGLFVVNSLLIAKGRSLDKIIQAETLESYPGLSQNLRKLTAAQYLAELCLHQALSEQPQEDLFSLLTLQLKQLERSPSDQVLALLVHGIVQLLTLAGLAPQLFQCCITQVPLVPDFSQPNWQAGFSIPAGGGVTLAALQQLQTKPRPLKRVKYQLEDGSIRPSLSSKVAEIPVDYNYSVAYRQPTELHRRLSAVEMALLQQLVSPDALDWDTLAMTEQLGQTMGSSQVWLAIEAALRHYTQYHFDCLIRSATLIDACFLPVPNAL